MFLISRLFNDHPQQVRYGSTLTISSMDSPRLDSLHSEQPSSASWSPRRNWLDSSWRPVLGLEGVDHRLWSSRRVPWVESSLSLPRLGYRKQTKDQLILSEAQKPDLIANSSPGDVHCSYECRLSSALTVEVRQSYVEPRILCQL